MGQPRLEAIENDIVLRTFNTASANNPHLRVKFYQPVQGTFYYRLRCVASGGMTFYLNIGSTFTTPNFSYTPDFEVQLTNILDSSFQRTNFENIFTYYSDTDTLSIEAYLQSCANSAFQTYDESTSVRAFNIRLEKDRFGPAWNAPTWVNSEYSGSAGVRTLVDSDQKGVQGSSHIVFTIQQATALYGTSVDYYQLSIAGETPIRFASTDVGSQGKSYTFDLTAIERSKLVGDVTVVFTVEDTRGQKRTFTRTITIVPYTKPVLTQNNTHRLNGTGLRVILDFTGKWYGQPLTLTCNSIRAQVRGSSAIFAELQPTLVVPGNNFSFNDEWSGVSFDADTAYSITANITDGVTTIDADLSIPVGTAVLSIRDKKIGINKHDPTCALDIVGDVKINNERPFSYVSNMSASDVGYDLNNCNKVGFYTHTSLTALTHCPSGKTGTALIRIVGNGLFYIQILHYMADNEVYIRTHWGSTYTAWKQVNMT